MVKYKALIFPILIIFFLFFSFYPTIFEISQTKKLTDPNREFILEHNYYWPDFNLYLSKVRQGYERRWLAAEKYTSEPHSGSFLQIFYVYLGKIGKMIMLDPNGSYQLGRILLSPFLLVIIMAICFHYFSNVRWRVLAFVITLVSGSFPNIRIDGNGFHVTRYMEWWSNIDALQRITFIPHILFGQVGSFYLLYRLAIAESKRVRKLEWSLFILLGNAVGIVFPPSLITLNGTLLLLMLVSSSRKRGSRHLDNWYLLVFILLTLPSLLYIYFITQQLPWSALVEFHRTHPMMIPLDQYVLGTGPIFFLGFLGALVSIIKKDTRFRPLILWVIVTLSFASFFSIAKEQSPLRFTQTGLFIPLGILGAYFFESLVGFFRFPIFNESNVHQQNNNGQQTINDDKSRINIGKIKLNHDFLPSFLRKYANIKDTIANNMFAVKNSISVKATAARIKPADRLIYSSESKRSHSGSTFILSIVYLFILLYILENLFIMRNSLDWQTTWITQRVGANIPPVPYPPQTMYPLREWMDGIRWLQNMTNHDDVVLAEITAGNFIPAYAGNYVYWGQSNTVDYERKQLEVEKFFKGEMSQTQAELFLKNGRIKYVFYSIQEKERSGGKNITDFYPFLKSVYSNALITIYRF